MMKRILLLSFVFGFGLTSYGQNKASERRKASESVLQEESEGGLSKVVTFIKNAGKVIDNPTKLRIEVEEEVPPREKPRSGFGKVIRFIRNVGKVMDDPTQLNISVEKEKASRKEE